MVLMTKLVQQKDIGINFGKANTKLLLNLHYNVDDNYLNVNKTEIYKFKANDSISWYSFGSRFYKG